MKLSGHLRWVQAAGVLALLPLTVLAADDGATPQSYVDAMRFAADMAKRGNWREAKFRWEGVVRTDPENPRVLNNLAVAAEALGDWVAARENYDRAIALTRSDTIIETNRERSHRFWSAVEAQGSAEVPRYNIEGTIPGDPEGVAKKKKKSKSFRVTVQLPVPPRLDLGARRKVLVVSFLTEESQLLDANRELVRFVRSELHKHTDLEILDVTPAPAVPEQTLDDLKQNAEFWRYLGREYGAEVIVSGVLHYNRRDSSGFRDVDVISETTGQKVRQSQFVEQERFAYELDLLLMDGVSGALLLHDRLQRSAIFRGTQNDPITAFYELSDSMAPDLLAIVKKRTKEDVRFVFSR